MTFLGVTITLFLFIPANSSPVLQGISFTDRFSDCTCVKVNSCERSKKLADEVENIQTNSVEDIKLKRRKIKKIKDHWCTLKNGNIGVNCCQNDKPPKCRTGCDCRLYRHCDWSMRDLQTLSMMNETQILYNNINKNFRENICSAPEKKVCCCGVREVCTVLKILAERISGRTWISIIQGQLNRGNLWHRPRSRPPQFLPIYKREQDSLLGCE